MAHKQNSGRYFGTDGFRGEAGKTLTSMQAYRVGRFLGWYYAEQAREARARIVIGKDTRRSSYMLEYALVAGITASGADAYMLHVITTPGVSYVTSREGFDCGVMITASHNPYYDNGIKLIDSRGEKLGDGVTALVEAYLDGDTAALGVEGDLPFATGEALGCIHDHAAGRNRYIGYLVSLAAHSYRHLRIGLDCANGAASLLAPAVFGALGGELFVIGDEPNGLNINENCGSTKLERLRTLVLTHHLDVGFAFDGDADRCLAIDEHGRTVSGDEILYILAKRLAARGMLSGRTVVGTVMTNSGLPAALAEAGIAFERTAVGDRFVFERMQERDLSLGGESSGHIIMRKYATTGDGILTAIMLSEEMADSKRPLSALASPVKLCPQHTASLRVRDKAAAVLDTEVVAAVEAVRSTLGTRGSVLLRASGTEPVVRVTVEAPSEDECRAHLSGIVDAIKGGGHTDEARG